MQKYVYIFIISFSISVLFTQRRINVNLVHLVKSFPTSIDLQKSASIQPRTSLSKFRGKFNSFSIRLLTPELRAVAALAGTRRGVDGMHDLEEQKHSFREDRKHLNQKSAAVCQRRELQHPSFDQLISDSCSEMSTKCPIYL